MSTHAALGAEYGCDMVSMARPLLANPHLPRMLEAGIPLRRNASAFCIRQVRGGRRCFRSGATSRRDSRLAGMARVRTDDEMREFMERQIERFNRPKQRPTPQSRVRPRRRQRPGRDSIGPSGLRLVPGSNAGYMMGNSGTCSVPPTQKTARTRQTSRPSRPVVRTRTCQRSGGRHAGMVRDETGSMFDLGRARRPAIAQHSMNCSCVRCRLCSDGPTDVCPCMRAAHSTPMTWCSRRRIERSSGCTSSSHATSFAAGLSARSGRQPHPRCRSLADAAWTQRQAGRGRCGGGAVTRLAIAVGRGAQAGDRRSLSSWSQEAEGPRAARRRAAVRARYGLRRARRCISARPARRPRGWPHGARWNGSPTCSKSSRRPASTRLTRSAVRADRE